MLPPRVFYNASAIPRRPGGAGIYTCELGRALLAAGVPLTVAASTPQEIFGINGIETPSGALRPSWELLRAASALRQSPADVYHGPHFFVPRTSVPSVATVHDLTFFRLPRRYGLAHRLYYRYLARTARRAHRIIVPTATVASDVVRYLGYPPERIRVIAEAPRTGLTPASPESLAELRAEFALPGPYLLCLGVADAGKRAIDVVRAMPAILARRPETRLVLAGGRGPLTASLRREAGRLGLSHAVTFPGYVPDQQLPALLTGAAALIYPSLHEGFGLPPLEALACGTPVILSETPALSDVFTGVATFVPVRSPGTIATESLRLLCAPNLQAERSLAGIEFSRRFSWQRAAEETIDVYREVAS